MQAFFQKHRVIILHLSFWCVYLSFFSYQVSSYQHGPDFNWGRVLTVVSIQVLFALFISYLNYFILLPRFLEKKNAWHYLVEFSIPFMLIMIVRLFVERYFIENFFGHEDYLYYPRFIVQVVTTNLFIVIFVAMLRFAVDWFEFESKKKAVENEKLVAELNFLKAQINPHFLFNTLNNLYYLAYTQSSNTTEVIAKLSQMMRYMIYDSNHAQVSLSKEIEYMQSYISLERLRLNNEIPIDFIIEGNTDQALIAPLILITFLENAFKHGVTNNNSLAWIKLSVKLSGKECIYTVSNSKVAQNTVDKNGKSGIGLQNVQRRLELSYPGQYQLKIEDRADQYFVQLNITLS